VQQAVLARFDQLPQLYDELNRTYESRFADRVFASVAAIVRILEAADAGPDARTLAEAMMHRLREMHDRYGVAVVLRPPPVGRAVAKQKIKRIRGS
jgi:hypothetical protein